MTTHDSARGPRREAVVSLRLLADNIRAVKGDVPVVDVSANAFGHGLMPVLQTARDAGALAFSARNEDEAEAARRAVPGLAVEVAPVDEERVAKIYGFDPDTYANTVPVMRLSADVVSVKHIRQGAGVSYGYTFRAPHDGWLALVPLGYGDGMMRAFGNVGRPVWKGKSCLIAGRVAMDVHSVFTGNDAASPGDEMIYFGDVENPAVPSVATWASLLGVPAAAVTSTLGSRVVRRWVL